MRIFAIDPGPTQSAWVGMIGNRIERCAIVDNDVLLWEIKNTRADVYAIEQIRSYGMAVGAEVFETCEWCGRFDQQIRISHGRPALFVPRKDVKLHLCNNTRANDSNIRQALIDLLGAPGTKRNPGPTYQVKSHIWAALGVAITAVDKVLERDNAN